MPVFALQNTEEETLNSKDGLAPSLADTIPVLFSPYFDSLQTALCMVFRIRKEYCQNIITCRSSKRVFKWNHETS